MNTQPSPEGPEKRIPYILTEAGRRVADEMQAKHPPLTTPPTRSRRRWALTDAAIALLNSEE